MRERKRYARVIAGLLTASMTIPLIAAAGLLTVPAAAWAAGP